MSNDIYAMEEQDFRDALCDDADAEDAMEDLHDILFLRDLLEELRPHFEKGDKNE